MVACQQIPCCNTPGCKGHLNSDGWSKTLHRVMGMSRTELLCYSKLRYSTCKRSTYADVMVFPLNLLNSLTESHSSVLDKVLAALGPAVTGCLPLVITRRGAMNMEAFNRRINVAVSTGTAFADIARQLAELYNSAYWEAANHHTEVAVRRDVILKRFLAASLQGTDVVINAPSSFSSIDAEMTTMADAAIRTANLIRRLNRSRWIT